MLFPAVVVDIDNFARSVICWGGLSLANSRFKQPKEAEIARGSAFPIGSCGYRRPLQARTHLEYRHPGRNGSDARCSKPDRLADCSPDPSSSRKRADCSPLQITNPHDAPDNSDARSPLTRPCGTWNGVECVGFVGFRCRLFRTHQSLHSGNQCQFSISEYNLKVAVVTGCVERVDQLATCAQ